jgi:MFS family permease
MQWSNTRKTLILVVCSLYSFLSNSALLGPSVYIGIYAEEFHITPNVASNLVSYANLAFGFGGLPGSNDGEDGADRCGQGRCSWCLHTTSLAVARSCSGRLLPYVYSTLTPTLFKTRKGLTQSWQYCGGLLACSQVTSYEGLMAARVIHAFGSSVCEALPVQLVNDIFFLHERGKRLGYYTGTFLSAGSIPAPISN